MNNSINSVQTLDRLQPVMGSHGINARPYNGIVNLQGKKAKTKRRCAFSMRKRGRQAEVAPSGKHRKIMNATKTQAYAEVGAKFRISRQRVGQIVRRWKQYMPVRSLRVPKTVLGIETNRLPKRENRIHVISFRLTAPEVQLLQLRYSEKLNRPSLRFDTFCCSQC